MTKTFGEIADTLAILKKNASAAFVERNKGDIATLEGGLETLATRFRAGLQAYLVKTLSLERSANVFERFFATPKNQNAWLDLSVAVQKTCNVDMAPFMASLRPAVSACLLPQDAASAVEYCESFAGFMSDLQQNFSWFGELANPVAIHDDPIAVLMKTRTDGVANLMAKLSAAPISELKVATIC